MFQSTLQKGYNYCKIFEIISEKKILYFLVISHVQDISVKTNSYVYIN